MLFNSFEFILFFIISTFTYYVVPKKIQNVWLLIINYLFYMHFGLKNAGILFTCTFLTYLVGISIDHGRKSKNSNKGQFAFCIGILFIVGVLIFYKYAGFIISNINSLLPRFAQERQIPEINLVLPAGISFFLLQTISYLADVYKGKQETEYNFIRYALYVSFFPQILSGPIERGTNMLPQYKTARKANFKAMRHGLYCMLFGYFMKLVIADRIAVFVNTVYSDYAKYTGAAIVLATVFYAIQIYCDFYGYSIIALGAAEILGIKVMDNFESPYLAQSVQEFWRRWHISLSSWLRDYIYFPLGGSRCSKIRAYLNLLMTFLVSGLWHGTGWNFILWGLVNGVYQIIGRMTKKGRAWILKKMQVNTDAQSFKVLRVIITFILIDFTWMIFRVNNLRDIPKMLKIIGINFQMHSILGTGLYNYGLSGGDFNILLISVLFLLLIDTMKYKRVDAAEWIGRQGWVFRALCVIIPTLFILLFGIWGNAYDPSSFIYFKF